MLGATLVILSLIGVAAYVAKVKEVTARNLAAGYILKPEADATIAEAEKLTIGR